MSYLQYRGSRGAPQSVTQPLDVGGFDTATPQLISDLARGAL